MHVQTQGVKKTAWTLWTPTISWSSGVSVKTGQWRQNNTDFEAYLAITLSGAPTATAFTITLPNSLVLPTDLTGGAFGALACPLYPLRLRDASATSNFLAYLTGNPGDNFLSLVNASYAAVNATAPFTWAVNDIISGYFKVPIEGW